MLKLNVIELLEEKGRTKYWLYKQLGMSYQNFNKMVSNETKPSVMKTSKPFVYCFTARQTNCL